MHVPRSEFEALVAQAVAEIPPEFRDRLENIEIVVEDRPQEEDLDLRDLPPGHVLLGVYRGVPLTERSAGASPLFPDRIAIFQHSLETIARTRLEIVAEVRRTVIHEIAHYFGISVARKSAARTRWARNCVKRDI